VSFREGAACIIRPNTVGTDNPIGVADAWEAIESSSRGDCWRDDILSDDLIDLTCAYV